MMEFLNLKELVPLTEQDINLDLQELRGLVDDSDFSISSSEVLTSHYPVRPRKTLAPRRDYDFRYDDYNYNLTNSRDGNNDQVEEALAYLKIVTTNRKDLAEFESTREELEALLQSYDMNYQYYHRVYSEQKQELAAYFRVLQGIFLRSMKSYLTNRTYYLSMDKLHQQLVDLRKCNAAHADAITAIKAKTTKPRKGATAASSAADGGSLNNPLVMKISIGQAKKELIVAVGQRIFTPFGSATVTSFDHANKKANLTLAFGLLFTTIHQLVIWVLNTERQFASTVDEIKKIVNQPSQSFRLQDLFLPNMNSVDANTPDCENKDDNSITENANLSEMDVASNNGGTDSLKDDGASEDMEITTQPDSDNNNHSNSNGSSSKENLLSFESSVTLPVPKYVQHVFEQNQADLFQRRAVLAVAPIDALPAVIREIQKKETDPSHVQITLDVSAVQHPTHSVQRNTSRIIPVDKLTSQFNEVMGNIQELESKQRLLVAKLEKIRSEGIRLSSMISNLRLGMFTRRIAHRNYLNSKGFATNLFLPTTTSRGGFKGNSAASSSSAASALLSMSILANAAANATLSTLTAGNVKEPAKPSESRRGGKGKAKVVEETATERPDLSSPSKYDSDHRNPDHTSTTSANGDGKKRGREDLDKESENNESNGEENLAASNSQKKKARRRRY